MASRQPRLALLTTICGLALVSTLASAASAQDWIVDATHSSVLFRIKHLETSYAWGRFNDVAGKIELTSGNPSVNVAVKADTIDTGNPKRDQHLKSPDFFNVKQFPTIGFIGTRVKSTGENTYQVEGTLTMHGVSRPLTVEIERTGTGKNQQGAKIGGFTTTFNIKRSEFGMNFLLEGLSDDVMLVVSLECAAK